MSITSSEETRKLTELLEKELEHYGTIRKLTEKQADLLAKDEIEEFDFSLDERAKIIEQIKGLHQESTPLMQSVSVSKEDTQAIKEIDSLKDRIRRELEFCNDLNEKNTKLMKEKTLEHSKKIDDHSAKRKGIGGYAAAVPNTPELFDKKS